jgi:predicted nucleotidyltransferase
MDAAMGYDRFPGDFRHDIELAVRILTELGAKHVYLFGSVLDNEAPNPRDIDIAVSGLPQDQFFRAYGKLTMTLGHPFDLVDLDNEAAFVRTLKESGQLEKVA